MTEETALPKSAVDRQLTMFGLTHQRAINFAPSSGSF